MVRLAFRHEVDEQASHVAGGVEQCEKPFFVDARVYGVGNLRGEGAVNGYPHKLINCGPPGMAKAP